jgi:hypothetical protein
MWRWLLILGLFIICLIPLPVLAQIPPSSADVVITATGVVVGSPGGLTLTYISDTQIGISWVKGWGAVNTMIRMKIGGYPANRFDGYMVYSGNETYCSDTGINLSYLLEDVYYKAWSQNGAGVWSVAYDANTFSEHTVLIANIMLLLFLLTLPIGLTILAFKSKFVWILFPVIVLWLVAALRCNALFVAQWDLYYILRILCVTMVFASGVLAFVLAAQITASPDKDDINIWGDKKSREDKELEETRGRSRANIDRMKKDRGRR